MFFLIIIEIILAIIGFCIQNYFGGIFFSVLAALLIIISLINANGRAEEIDETREYNEPDIIQTFDNLCLQLLSEDSDREKESFLKEICEYKEIMHTKYLTNILTDVLSIDESYLDKIYLILDKFNKCNNDEESKLIWLEFVSLAKCIITKTKESLKYARNRKENIWICSLYLFRLYKLMWLYGDSFKYFMPISKLYAQLEQWMFGIFLSIAKEIGANTKRISIDGKIAFVGAAEELFLFWTNRYPMIHVLFDKEWLINEPFVWCSLFEGAFSNCEMGVGYGYQKDSPIDTVTPEIETNILETLVPIEWNKEITSIFQRNRFYALRNNTYVNEWSIFIKDIESGKMDVVTLYTNPCQKKGDNIKLPIGFDFGDARVIKKNIILGEDL